MRRGRGRVRVHFLPVRGPGKTTTQRDTELEIAEARAHAAKVAHWRRGEGRQPSEPSFKPRPQVHDNNVVLTSSYIGFESLPVLHKPAEIGSNGNLDPFILLAVDLSRPDRDLIHFYITTVGGNLHGTSSRPIFCPVRDCTLPGLATNEMCLRWIVFVAEVMLASIKTTDLESGRMAIAARRASNYRFMRQKIANSDSWSRNSTVFGLTVAATAEFRAGDTLLARKHLKIAGELLARKEGMKLIQTMGFAEGMIVLNAFVSIGLPAFKTCSETEDALDRWQRRMTIFSETRVQIVISHELRGYFEMQINEAWRTQMAIMHLLNCILSSGMADKKEEYIKSLIRMIRGSQGSAPLSPLAVLSMLCSCAVQMGWWSVRKETPLKSWETLELLALMELAPRSRPAVIACLASRAVGGWMVDLDVEAVRGEIISNWEELRWKEDRQMN